jgi:hypothetical protein
MHHLIAASPRGMELRQKPGVNMPEIALNSRQFLQIPIFPQCEKSRPDKQMRIFTGDQ